MRLKRVRKKPGTKVVNCQNNAIKLKKDKCLDVAYVEVLNHMLFEWNSKEDDDAFEDLQNFNPV